ncbi:hypothetical protein [Rhodanobacter denitrificans]|uniref:hypothetical protein n=1 Tax=Rhodanobacter denitrificans TaxID=666685 RepID=UPI001F47FACF|nr:hypothetical protein [Rhodanobacter denitrificans]UJJ60647.1 hypothetical protein LRK55_19635 [Rhodanobacter denitrificans]
MRLESAFAINLRIGISVLVGVAAALISCVATGRDLTEGVSLGSLVSAGVLLGSYVLVPARADGS